jgi:molybdopterin synthase catalytic subunit
MAHAFLFWPPETPVPSQSFGSAGVRAPSPANPTAIVSTPLSVDVLRAWVSTPRAGAILVFEGTVRSTSQDRSDVTALEYEVKASMADKVITGILAETAMAIPVERLAVAHRQGVCQLGEPTIVIAVAAGHRDEAYRASRLLIDRIKHEAPIWKRELFSDGSGAWSEGCTACSHPHYHPKPHSGTHG